MNQKETGKFISTCRKDKGLTQMQLAEMLEAANRAVSKWETGKSCPDVSIYAGIMRYPGNYGKGTALRGKNRYGGLPEKGGGKPHRIAVKKGKGAKKRM